MKKATANVLAMATTAAAYTGSTAGTQQGCYWNVPGAGIFNTNFGSDWSVNLTSTIEDLIPSTYTVLAGVNPLPRRFDMVNIGLDVIDLAITLTVPGGQTQGPISSAQLETNYNDILYGSVRTVAKISNVPGTTHGFIFYSNDTQETDFAFLTSDISKAWFTNEQNNYTAPYSTYNTAAPSDAATAWHEYRVDWLPGKTQFYIDGTLVQTITDNVPTIPGAWIWNNWSNGNAWAQGPPLKDSVLKIRKIDAYFNRTSVADSMASNPDQVCAAAYSSASSSTAPSSSSIVSSSSMASSATSTSTSATAAATAASFYIKVADNKYVSVSKGQDGTVSYVSSTSSATKFTLDPKTGYLLEASGSVGYAANRGTSSNAEILYFDSVGSSYSYLTCSQDTSNGWLVCYANKVLQQAMTCNANTNTMYTGPTIPSSCAWVPLYYVSADSTSSSSVVTSSSSSSVVASTSKSSSSSITSSTLTPATVQFTTVTTAWTGTYTTTTTVVNGLSATVIVETPAKKGQVVSTSKITATTTTLHSGTASTVGYITATPKYNSATTTVTIVYPTPATSCSNAGINFAAYTNKYPGGQATSGYPTYSPEAYKTATPSFSGQTTYIAESNDGDLITVYGKKNVDGTTLVLDHTFYLFASQTGYYSFNIPYTDDIQFAWIGSKAVSGWTRANADITQFWSSDIATQTPQTLAYYLTVGQYIPVRVQWGNGGGAGDLQFNIYAPDGSTVLSSNAGTNTGTTSPDVVQFPCSGGYTSFPAWGKET